MKIAQSLPTQLVVNKSDRDRRMNLWIGIAAIWGVTLGTANIGSRDVLGNLGWNDVLCWWLVLLAIILTARLMVYREMQQVIFDLERQQVLLSSRYLWGKLVSREWCLVDTQIGIRRQQWWHRRYFQVVLLRSGKRPIALSDWSSQRHQIDWQAHQIRRFLRVSPTAQQIM